MWADVDSSTNDNVGSYLTRREVAIIHMSGQVSTFSKGLWGRIRITYLHGNSSDQSKALTFLLN